MITPEQCRAARALLDWTQLHLANEAKVSDFTIRNFERGRTALKASTAQLVRMIFEANGLVFIDENGGGPGVRLEKPVKGKA
ncbi:helix-turn-helix domain-containing protein [Henriciella aquimarina]|uniref:helix-turn-helix domain-containing protein n=1 Tax=Henriciella aquimarina TaxID=545261 RepID=UPI000A006ACD|nr:transcriptional regulator [Henriciella aquimarina]